MSANLRDDDLHGGTQKRVPWRAMSRACSCRHKDRGDNFAAANSVPCWALKVRTTGIEQNTT